MRYRIDSSDRTHLAICACSWRSPVYLGPDGKMRAREALAKHERDQHTGASSARTGLHHARRRREHHAAR